jgi:hypothetical protein
VAARKRTRAGVAIESMTRHDRHLVGLILAGTFPPTEVVDRLQFRFPALPTRTKP